MHRAGLIDKGLWLTFVIFEPGPLTHPLTQPLTHHQHKFDSTCAICKVGANGTQAHWEQLEKLATSVPFAQAHLRLEQQGFTLMSTLQAVGAAMQDEKEAARKAAAACDGMLRCLQRKLPELQRLPSLLPQWAYQEGIASSVSALSNTNLIRLKGVSSQLAKEWHRE